MVSLARIKDEKISCVFLIMNKMKPGDMVFQPNVDLVFFSGLSGLETD